MAIRWTATARSDLVRLRNFLAAANPSAAARAVQRLQGAPKRLLPYHPRLGVRLPEFSPREVRRLFVDDYELRYEIRGNTIL